jgi:hypothetical protein
MLFACFGVSIDVFLSFSYSALAVLVLVLELEDTASSTIKAKTAQLQKPTSRDLCSSLTGRMLGPSSQGPRP